MTGRAISGVSGRLIAPVMGRAIGRVTAQGIVQDIALGTSRGIPQGITRGIAQGIALGTARGIAQCVGLPLICLGLLLVCGSAAAHDFWIQPGSYEVAPGTNVPFTLQVGHGPYRQRSMLPMRRITRFGTVGPDGTRVDLREGLNLGDATEDGELRFEARGTYVVVLETDNRAQSYQPSVRFNNYLRDEGLAAALEQREQSHRMDVDGAESYSRHSKALVRVGPREASVQVTRPVGMALEIVPEIDPYAAPLATEFPVRVFFEEKPLPGALVKLTDLDHDAEPVETQLTDEDGRSSFTIPDHGRWLLNVIWSKPRPVTQETDFETYFSSLSFGR